MDLRSNKATGWIDRSQHRLDSPLAEQLEVLKATLDEEHGRTQKQLLQRIEATRSLEAENRRLQQKLAAVGGPPPMPYSVLPSVLDELREEMLVESPEPMAIPSQEYMPPRQQMSSASPQKPSTSIQDMPPALPLPNAVDGWMSGDGSLQRETSLGHKPPTVAGPSRRESFSSHTSRFTRQTNHTVGQASAHCASARTSNRISNGKRMLAQMMMGGIWRQSQEVPDERPSWHDIVDYTVRGNRPVAAFADADAMKEKVRQAILQPEETLFDLYSTEGCAQRIARSPVFDMCTLVVISLNAIWLAIETDHNNETILLKADVGFQIVEHVFCTYFFLEWIIRFTAFRHKMDCVKDVWFCIDSFLVSAMVFETWVLTLIFATNGSGATADVGTTSIIRIVRIFRLSRAARVARLLKSIPELMVIVRGIMVVTRTVTLIFVLLLLIMYIFAVMFTQLAKDSSLQESHFPNVRESMVNLLLGGILPDMAPWTYALGEDSLVFAVLFIFFVLLAFVTVMNMLIGVLVEVVGVVASVEKESNQAASIRNTFVRLLDESGTELRDEEGFTLHDFTGLLSQRSVVKALRDVGIDAIGLVDYADYIFRESKKISFPDFLDLLLQLRGGNPAKVSDLVELRKYIRVELGRLESTLTEVLSRVRLTPRGAAPKMMATPHHRFEVHREVS